MKTIRKFLRVVECIYMVFVDITFALFGYFVLFLFVGNKPDWPYYVYAIVVLLLIARNVYHKCKWFICAHPTKIRCLKCHSLVPLKRYGEDHYLKSPVSVYFPKYRQTFAFTDYKRSLLYKPLLRPYLELDCPECGERQVICPYCKEPIQQELVETYYEKTAKCPHCGKRVYTPTPVQDSDKYVIIGNILD